MKYYRIPSLIILFLNIGCASFLTATKNTVAITSYPNDARFIIKNIDGEMVALGQTPQLVTLRGTRKGYLVEFSKKGYQNKTAHLKSKIKEATIFSILWYGVGLLIDFGSGNAYKFDKDYVNVALTKIQD